MTRFFGLTVSLSLTLLVISAEVVCGEDPVVFGDSDLKVAVEAALGVLDPTPTDMLRLTDLSAPDRVVSNLTGLEHALNLETLDIADSGISDISPLAGLTSLQNLDLAFSEISDVSPLADLTNLQELKLSVNQISDISILAGLTNLQRLELAANQISDISPLAGLTGLSFLRLEGNPLDCAAHCEFIPTISQNNPGLSLRSDDIPEGCNCPAPHFVRGDSNSDSEVNFADAVYTLDWLFRGGPTPSCQDTADANDDGRLNITDTIYTLLFLFKDGSPLPSPGQERCGGGPDLTEDALTCSAYPRCGE